VVAGLAVGLAALLAIAAFLTSSDIAALLAGGGVVTAGEAGCGAGRLTVAGDAVTPAAGCVLTIGGGASVLAVDATVAPAAVDCTPPARGGVASTAIPVLVAFLAAALLLVSSRVKEVVGNAIDCLAGGVDAEAVGDGLPIVGSSVPTSGSEVLAALEGRFAGAVAGIEAVY
jgi:hypothetical protein